MKSQFANFDGFLAEVERAAKTNVDLHVGAGNIRMEQDEFLSVEKDGQRMRFPVNQLCHCQLAEKTRIPMKYYDEMKTIEGLRTLNVNEWIRHNNEVNFLRVQDGTARALLSASFFPIDHFLLLRDTLIPVLAQFKNVIEFRAMALSSRNMFIQAQIPSMQAEIKVGDLVSYGFGFRNSEVGLGAYDAYGMMWELACTNGRVLESLIKKYHVGRRVDMEDESVKIYREETLSADLTALKMKIVDVLTDALKGDKFMFEVNKLKAAAYDIIPDNNVKNVVENVTRQYGFTEKESDSILKTLWQRNDPSRYGVHNAITALAHQTDDPDRGFEYEKIGTQIIELNPSQWQVLQKVA